MITRDVETTVYGIFWVTTPRRLQRMWKSTRKNVQRMNGSGAEIRT